MFIDHCKNLLVKIIINSLRPLRCFFHFLPTSNQHQRIFLVLFGQIHKNLANAALNWLHLTWWSLLPVIGFDHKISPMMNSVNLRIILMDKVWWFCFSFGLVFVRCIVELVTMMESIYAWIQWCRLRQVSKKAYPMMREFD